MILQYAMFLICKIRFNTSIVDTHETMEMYLPDITSSHSQVCTTLVKGERPHLQNTQDNHGKVTTRSSNDPQEPT